MQMKKICVIVSVAGFIKSFMAKDLQLLSEYFAITIISSDNINFKAELDIKSVSKQIKIARKISIYQDFKTLFLLTKYLYKNNFDIVLSITPKAGLLAMLSAFIVRVPKRIHFFTGQVWANKTGFSRYFLKFIDRFINYLTTYTLVAGKAQREFLIGQNIIKKTSSKTLFHGVDIAKFSKNDIIKKQLLAKYNLSSDNIVFMFLGRINKDKGILDLITVMRDLLPVYNNLVCFIVGEDEGDISNKLTEFSSLERVFILAKTNKPEQILNLANVLVLPSYREGCAFTPLECAVIEVPAIVSDIYGLTDSVINNTTGLVHKVGDIDDMKDKYSTLITNKELTKTLGKNAYDRVLSEFDSNITAKLFVDFFTNLYERPLHKHE